MGLAAQSANVLITWADILSGLLDLPTWTCLEMLYTESEGKIKFDIIHYLIFVG